MTIDPNPANNIAKAILSELDHFQDHFKPSGGALSGAGQHRLLDEPCVGYALTQKPDGTQVEVFLCRNYVPLGYEPSRTSIDYASYLSPMGRIIAKKPGDAHSFEVKHHKLGFLLEAYTYALQAKDEFRPRKEDSRWDATDNQMAWIGGRVAVRSLRKLLEGIKQGEPGRTIRYSVELPDQAILDEAQDDVFRLPLASYVFITGAPGTGKTTVLLKRLSQKTKKEFLTEAELKSLTDQTFQDGRNWILFTPSDLLKVYLKEAMGKELLPATDENVKVYRTFRLEVLRDSGFIKVGQRGYFKQVAPDTMLMKRVSGAEQLSLNKAFGDFLPTAYSLRFRESLQHFNNEIRGPLGKLTDASQEVLVAALDILGKAGGDVIAFQNAQRRAAEYRNLNEDLKRIVETTRGIAEALDTAAAITPSVIYNYVGRWQRDGLSLSPAKIDTAVFPHIPPLVSKLRTEVKGLVEALSLARMFLLIPRAYQEFRERTDIKNRFFDAKADKAVGDRQLSEPEQDVLLLHALEFTRQLRTDLPGDLAGVPDELRSLVARFRLLVTVDEATDFSPLELACIERLALPEGGVTISGDLMQRVTENGLREWSDIETVCRPHQRCELNVSYRQTERLFNIARDLYRHAAGSEPKFKSAYPHRPEDPPALTFRSGKETPAAQWLVDRICEIFTLGNNHLPTTAILVPTPADVEPLRTALFPLLYENGLELDASQGGQNLGDAARVRIFPVEQIKGLEFEAVFYVGLDRMAEVHRELIDKYVYVGLSRARSFLGVAFERQFPVRLKCIESHFEYGGSWNKVIPERGSGDHQLGIAEPPEAGS
jgi:hypothetical protein